MHPIIIRIMATLLLATGLVIRNRIKRRRFYRRTMTGAERFSSYGRSVLIPALEKIVFLMANLFILASILILLSTLV